MLRVNVVVPYRREHVWESDIIISVYICCVLLLIKGSVYLWWRDCCNKLYILVNVKYCGLCFLMLQHCTMLVQSLLIPVVEFSDQC